MSTFAGSVEHGGMHPVDVFVEPSTRNRNRLTGAFRLILAIPHLLLVGAPIAVSLSWESTGDAFPNLWLGGGGALGAVAAVVAFIAWFAILFTGRYPDGLWNLAAFYLRWRVRAVAYTALLRDEYPPFGEGAYPATVKIEEPASPRDRLTVAFRIVLAIPHILIVWVLGVAWMLTSIVAWAAIILTGEYPEGLYRFGVNVFRWSTRLEAYLLLLHDEFPPFAFE